MDKELLEKLNAITLIYSLVVNPTTKLELEKLAETLMSNSLKKTDNSNIYMKYVSERIIKEPISGNRLKLCVIKDDFKEWYKTYYDNKDIPYEELKKYLMNVYGHYPTNGWSHIGLSEEDI